MALTDLAAIGGLAAIRGMVALTDPVFITGPAAIGGMVALTDPVAITGLAGTKAMVVIMGTAGTTGMEIRTAPESLSARGGDHVGGVRRHTPIIHTTLTIQRRLL